MLIEPRNRTWWADPTADIKWWIEEFNRTMLGLYLVKVAAGPQLLMRPNPR